MFEPIIFPIILVLATLFTTLVAGLVFTFAIITMPGINKLEDRDFIRAFQVMDGVIQNNQPLFVLVWLGSVVMLIAATAFGIGQLDGIQRWLIIAATVIYVVGVQLPTIIINIPLNNELQSLNVDVMDAAALNAARSKFEPRWNQANMFRTVVVILVSVMLMSLLLGM